MECISIFQGLSVDDDEVQYLEESKRMSFMAQASYRLCYSFQVWSCQQSQYNMSTSVTSEMHSVMESMKVPALNWGITNKPITREGYVDRIQALHDEFAYERAGLFINPALPHLGA